MKKVIILDYDNTLAKPKSSPTDDSLSVLRTLLDSKRVAILTAGRSIKGLRELLTSKIADDNSYLLKNLYLCPKYGNSIFSWEKDWFVLYEAKSIDSKEKRVIEKIVKKLNWKKYVEKSSKQRIHDKGPVISINCIGNDATEEEKESWDPDGIKRMGIKEDLLERLGSDYEVYITGRNTVDIVPRGMNKADNVLKLLELISESSNDCVYIGDEFNPNGNDYPILSLGIEVHKVDNPEETKEILNRYI